MFSNPNKPSVDFTTCKLIHHKPNNSLIIPEEAKNFVFTRFSSLCDLPTIVCMTRIIRSFFSTHPSRFFAIQTLKGNERREMCLQTQCKLESVTVLQNECFSTILPSAQIYFPQDHTYLSILSFLQRNSSTTLKSMTNNGSLSMHRISPLLSQNAFASNAHGKATECWYIRETDGLCHVFQLVSPPSGVGRL